MASDTNNALMVRAQRAEITEYHIYRRLARIASDAGNRKILEDIAGDERRHYERLKEETGQKVQPSRWRIFFYYWLARILGLTFTLRLMESGEDMAQKNYRAMAADMAFLGEIEREECEHEHALIGMISEEKLQYASSVVLGLNDALVELTGAIAGFTLALQNTRLVAMTSLVTGIAAALSMAASEYLSTKTEEDSSKHPVKASVYTGIAYVLATACMVAPFFILSNHFACLSWTMINALVIILLFTFYISVAKGYSFRRRFLEMALISLGVAAISFFIGLAVRHFLGVEV